MVQRFENKGSRGFSLVETLAVVAILVILLSLSAVAAAYYRDYLKITELDNAARDIYMAAENRAVLLGGSGQLEKALSSGGAQTLAEGGEQQASVYVAKDTAASLGLLTGGAIDPALLNGQFYIVYDTASGAVTDVFYTEGPDIQDIHYALSIAGNRDKRMRPDSGPMLGYYGGGQAEGEETGPASAPYIDVEIDNGERLTVKVTYWLPQSVGSGDYILDVSLNYDTQKLDLQNAGHSGRLTQTGPTASGSGNTYTKTWVLDELGDRRFYELFREEAKVIAPGDSFTVTGTLTPAGDKFDEVTDSDTDNSLFSERSTGDTANIACLRHLQNLDQGYSKVAGKTKAVQESVILCHSSNETYQGYNFTPITNEELTSYDGKQLEIRELYVAGAGKDSGLWHHLYRGTAGERHSKCQ